MKGICPNCEKETTLERIHREEVFDIRGEPVKVEVHLFKCEECGEEFEDPQASYDPVEEAYRIYRSRKGMVQPEEMRAFRRKYGLTQKELGELLGWGGATLSRYENGALQSEAHDQLLKLVMQPENLLHLASAKPEVFDAEKREKITGRLKQEVDPDYTILDLYEEQLGSYEPDIESGYKTLDLQKFCNMILYFCYEDEIPKTKLNKLLFYADFLHFKMYGVSISGARYARLPFGPVPDNFNLLFAALIDEKGALQAQERAVYDYMGEFYAARAKPDLSIFDPGELKVLAAVKEFFGGFSSKEISEFAHKEKGYLETETGRLIPYSYAEWVGIDT